MVLCCNHWDSYHCCCNRNSYHRDSYLFLPLGCFLPILVRFEPGIRDFEPLGKSVQRGPSTVGPSGDLPPC